MLVRISTAWLKKLSRSRLSKTGPRPGGLAPVAACKTWSGMRGAEPVPPSVLACLGVIRLLSVLMSAPGAVRAPRPSGHGLGGLGAARHQPGIGQQDEEDDRPVGGGDAVLLAALEGPAVGLGDQDLRGGGGLAAGDQE